jgi:hypothetical protein
VIYKEVSEAYYLLKDGEIVFSGHRAEAHRRYKNTLENQEKFDTDYLYELITEKEYRNR